MEVGGHRLTCLGEGPDRLAAMLDMIDGATSSLQLMFYIFAPDRSGRLVRDALVAAARRGVKVTMILDSFGSSKTSDQFFATLTEAGGRHYWFSTRWTPRYLLRNHQKLVIADGERLLCGGFNVEDGYFAAAEDAAGWRDLGLMVEGPDAAMLSERYAGLMDWVSSPRPKWRELRQFVDHWDSGGRTLQWLVGGPTPRISRWVRSVKRDLTVGRDLTMVMAYFAPGQSLLRRIARIGRHGRATLILPAKSDNGATIGAARALYRFLLKRGVGIAEYQPQKLHQKLIIVDQATYIGSANFDMRSLFMNLELVLRVDDAAFTERMRASVSDLQARSQLIDIPRLDQMAGWLTRLRWALSWFAVSIVDYGVTRRLNLGLKAD